MLIAALAALILPQAEPDVSWMAGYWLDCSNGREASETWSDPRAGLMVGHAVTVSRNGRPSFEVSSIGMTPQGLAYIAQPGGAPPTIFILTENAGSRAVFSNPDNDFPQRVIYWREGDVLNARIEGDINGEAQSMDWRFDKAELNARCPTA